VFYVTALYKSAFTYLLAKTLECLLQGFALLCSPSLGFLSACQDCTAMANNSNHL